jgi:hypothetical protein
MDTKYEMIKKAMKIQYPKAFNAAMLNKLATIFRDDKTTDRLSSVNEWVEYFKDIEEKEALRKNSKTMTI